MVVSESLDEVENEIPWADVIEGLSDLFKELTRVGIGGFGVELACLEPNTHVELVADDIRVEIGDTLLDYLGSNEFN